jgi:hypothetical protein
MLEASSGMARRAKTELAYLIHALAREVTGRCTADEPTPAETLWQ